MVSKSPIIGSTGAAYSTIVAAENSTGPGGADTHGGMADAMVRHRSISHHKHHRQVEIKDGNELHPYVEQKGQEAHDAHFHADPSERSSGIAQVYCAHSTCM